MSVNVSKEVCLQLLFMSLFLFFEIYLQAPTNFKSSPVPKSLGGGGGNTSETEDSGGRRDSPLSASALSGGGNVNASAGGMGLNQSLSIKQELIDAQQQQQREHHVSLPPEYLPVSLWKNLFYHFNS